MNDLETDFVMLAPGLSEERYYRAWRLLIILWRGLWWGSTTNWSRYRARIWEMFPNWLLSAARRGRDLSSFLSGYCKVAHIPIAGSNENERTIIAEYMALPEHDQRAILRQVREELPVLMALLRLYRDRKKEEMESNNRDND